MNILIDFGSALIFLIPVLLFFCHKKEQKGIRTFTCFLFCSYLCAVYLIVGLPTVLFHTVDVTFHPFKASSFLKDPQHVFLNVLLFVPLGFFLPVLWKKYTKFGYTLLFGLGSTVSIEMLQMLTYRITDVNDIVTNFLGCLCGFVAYVCTRRISRKFLSPADTTSDLRFLLCSCAAILFFLQPIAANLLYRIL